MFCPTCHKPNPVGGQVCWECDARLPDRGRVYVGSQFILLDADDRCPIAASLDGGTPMTVIRPTIISRHRHAVAFGDDWDDAQRWRDRPQFGPIPDQPRLDALHLDLTAVVTERRIYRPKDEARIFVVAPDHGGGLVDLEVRLADQQIMRVKETLNAAGLALVTYADLEEGEYTVRVRRIAGQPAVVGLEHNGQPESDLPQAEPGEWAECHFSVAEFTLSPLIAKLGSHTFGAGVLRFQLHVQQLSMPYTGEVTVALQCAACQGRIVQTREVRAEEGAVNGEFDLSGHDGPFKLQLTTSQGETALVDLPGSGAGERERIIINPLGQVAEASLLPGDDTELVRGMYIGHGGVSATPLRLESAVARRARFSAAGNFSDVQIVAHSPLSGDSAVHAWHNVTRGEEMTVDVHPPFTFFTVATITPSGLHEGWATVVHPPDLKGTLTAPDQAAPGDQITVTLNATASPGMRPRVHCLLLAYDARLEHESPQPKLGQRQYHSIRDAGGALGNGPAPDATHITPPVLYRSMRLAAGPPLGALDTLYALKSPAMAAAVSEGNLDAQLEASMTRPRVPAADEAEAPPLSVPPTREDFPELAYLELFEFDGQAERVVPLGDQIGIWRCRAYLISGLDLLELTADVQADKPLYAELDLPAIVADGDQIEASVTYHSSDPAEMTITLPGGETIQGLVMGHGAERFRLSGPGEVSVQLSSSVGQDWTARTVKAPGVQTVTASRLELLRAGETISGRRVVVYPGVAMVLTDTIEALLHYPFG